MNALHQGFSRAISLLADPLITPQDLYEKWWSGSTDETRLAPLPLRYHQPEHARFVLKEADYEVYSVGTHAVVLYPGDFLKAGEQVVVITRLESWATDHWNWCRGAHGYSYPLDPETVRIYIPSNSIPVVELFADIVNSFNANRISFEMKHRRAGGVFSDNIVIWIQARFLSQATTLVKDCVGDSQWNSSPPPLALHWNGLGLCAHPKDDSSAGWNFSELLWTVVRGGQLNDIHDSLVRRGFDPHKPWRLNQSSISNWDVSFNDS
jgi:hypothetical protein